LYGVQIDGEFMWDINRLGKYHPKVWQFSLPLIKKSREGVVEAV